MGESCGITTGGGSAWGITTGGGSAWGITTGGGSAWGITTGGGSAWGITTGGSAWGITIGACGIVGNGAGCVALIGGWAMTMSLFVFTVPLLSMDMDVVPEDNGIHADPNDNPVPVSCMAATRRVDFMTTCKIRRFSSTNCNSSSFACNEYIPFGELNRAMHSPRNNTCRLDAIHRCDGNTNDGRAFVATRLNALDRAVAAVCCGVDDSDIGHLHTRVRGTVERTGHLSGYSASCTHTLEFSDIRVHGDHVGVHDDDPTRM
jgi:hypothetical protein